MRALASANLVVRFLCELAALAALAVWGAQASDDPAVQVLLGIAVPMIMIAVWGMWVAPKASRRVPDPWRAGIEVLVFGAAVAGLVDAGHAGFGIALGVLAAVMQVRADASQRRSVAWLPDSDLGLQRSTVRRCHNSCQPANVVGVSLVLSAVSKWLSACANSPRANASSPSVCGEVLLYATGCERGGEPVRDLGGTPIDGNGPVGPGDRPPRPRAPAG